MVLVVRAHHTQFPGRGAPSGTWSGLPLWPGLRPPLARPVLAVAAVLVRMGGLVQINPIWQWGPYDPYRGDERRPARLVPRLADRRAAADAAARDGVAGRTLVPNPFFGGVLFPLLLFAFLYAWPAVERRITGDRAPHNLLDRPRDNPLRTAVGSAVLTLTLSSSSPAPRTGSSSSSASPTRARSLLSGSRSCSPRSSSSWSSSEPASSSAEATPTRSATSRAR